MTDQEQTTETPPATLEPVHILAPLVRSLPAAYLVFMLLVGGFALSTLLFLVQLRMEVEPFILLTDSRSGRLAVYSHLARACACLLLAFALQRYIASLRRIRHNTPDALDRFFKASRFLWRALFLCALLVIGMGLWAFDVRRDPAADFAVGQEIYSSNPEPKVQVEFYLAETRPGKGLEERLVRKSGESIWLPVQPILSNEHFLQAQVGLDSDQTPVVTMKLNEEGTAIIRQASREHRDNPLAILVDGEVIMAPNIAAPMGSEIMITGIKTTEEAQRIARSISGNE
ncbi:SecDF P1 head subdomain-containing protein [Gimesia panareensis]|uniref:SecDF P1 head subdomain-containing protein n=1 Tax=Gimesia panareensis TaxID=2527978 RepID=UPI001189066D|nr:hypothetical protein [Gimesia panareensis]QDU53422.1 preprotein translocase subunit SecD [Gimesia panareensis]